MPELPEGDVFCHSGDFTHNGTLREVMHFLRWLEKQPHKYKVICPGNHDLVCVDNDSFMKITCESMGINYLCDDEVIIDGIKFYGSPYTKLFGGMAFEYREQELVPLFERIPPDVNVLITHGPPYGILDKNSDGHACGSKALADKLHYTNVPRMKVCAFGHIHEGYGRLNHAFGLHPLSSVHPGAKYMNVALAGARDFSWRKRHPDRIPAVVDIK